MADFVRLGKKEEEAQQRRWQQQLRLQGKGGRGEMEGGVEGEVGEEVCWAVLIIVISIIHSNNTYFTAIPLLE